MKHTIGYIKKYSAKCRQYNTKLFYIYLGNLYYLVLFVQLFCLIYLSLNNMIGLVHVLYLVNFICISFITVYIDIDTVIFTY